MSPPFMVTVTDCGRSDIDTNARARPRAGKRGTSSPTARAGPTVRCRIPDDCIDPKRYPLFMARAVLQELIESLQSNRGVKSC